MKRTRSGHDDQRQNKRAKLNSSLSVHPTTALLRQCYAHVLTLRQYLISQLPKSSKKRRRKVAQYGEQHGCTQDEHDQGLSRLLDSTIVGSSTVARHIGLNDIDKDIVVFTQQLSESTSVDSATQGALKQSEIVDFVIWQLFRRHVGNHRLAHQLCHGYQRHCGGLNGAALQPVPGVPGVFAACANPNVQTLKGHPWTALPDLLGTKTECIISDMLIGCGVFVPVGDGSSLTQLSGKPMHDIKSIRQTHEDNGHSALRKPIALAPKKRGLSDIRFVRHRMLYARPSSSAKGNVRFGLGYIHALNRGNAFDDIGETAHLMKYVFPRQYGLHNVFTSETDYRETVQPFKDYTLREKEIARATHDWRRKRRQTDHPHVGPPIPRRLRGSTVSIFSRVRKRHAKCQYHALLQHYCPVRSGMETTSDQSTLLASSPEQVSAFCRSAVFNVFPDALWGSGGPGERNRQTISLSIDKFIHLRRFESISMHEVMQGISLSEVQWLVPPKADSALKLSRTDRSKREEVMAELLYYVFDSYLIPLLRGCFYVTESTAHRNQLFYFRHDVWQAMATPTLASLKDTMMEECSPAVVRKLLATRALGVSHVRLLPKERGMRPIINLRRRVQTLQHGQMVLGRSINGVLTPAFSVLNCEKGARPELLASALFSVDDIYPRLQAFRDSLRRQGQGHAPLYFGKVDVQACFDTIPQKRLMSLVRAIISAEEYGVTKYARGKLIGKRNEENRSFGGKPSWRFLTKASKKADPFDFAREVEAETAAGRGQCLFIDGVVQKTEQRSTILNLLEEHVEANLVKIDKRVYRQKKGIPQGSIVSTLLCSYIYGELEGEILGFLSDGQSLLLRLIDDFLVISTREEQVERFMQVMHNGVPQYGVQAKIEKSRTNFDLLVNGKAVSRVEAADFPYCGHSINTQTLDLSKDTDRRKASSLANSITVEYSRLPGQTFYRKMLTALKLQMHTMLLETGYNSLQTVLSNLYHCFAEVAQKSYYYIRSLPPSTQPGSKLVIKTVDDTVKLAIVLMKGPKRTTRHRPPYECSVSSAQARWLAYTAFTAVFRQRQTKYAILIAWLGKQLETPRLRVQNKELSAVADRYRR